METLAAVSLAGNIVNFLDFGLKIVSKGREIYHAIDGAFSEHNDLEVVTRDLLLLQTQMEQSLVTTSAAADLGGHDVDLVKLLESSNKLARNLLECLNKAKALGRFRRWKSLRQAVKSVSSKGEVDDMANRLSMYRAQFQGRVLSSLSTRINQAADDLKAQIACSRNIRKMLEDFGVSFKSVSAKIDNLSSKFAGGRDRCIEIDTHMPLNFALGGPERTLRSVLCSKGDRDIEKTILKTLEYEQMEVRRQSIPEAHAKTFRWILDGLVDDPDVWSGRLPLIRVDFFFWSLGTPLQKSQSGLLMSLLRQLLGKRPDLIPTVLPELWRHVSDMDHITHHSLETSSALNQYRWTFADLSSTFDAMMCHLMRDGKVVIFIDGLDEFDGDHGEITEIFNHYATLHDSNIKICVSSRPLMPFEYSFKGCKHLRLQDLTARDIRTYITDKLNCHRHFEALATTSPNQAYSFIGEVAAKSSGVFLWVYLIVKSLLTGLTNHDSIDDLARRLEALPPELDALYRAMLRSINPPFYRGQASQLLQIAYQHKDMMSSLALSYADDPDSAFALKLPIGPLSLQQVDTRIEAISYRVQSRCQGLLEVHKFKACEKAPANPDTPFRWDEVRYLHLSLRDYLEKPDIWGDLMGWTARTEFDANLACARSLLLRVKTSACYYGWGFYIWNLLDRAIQFTCKAELSTGHAHVDLVDEIHKVATDLLPPGRSLPWFTDDRGMHAEFCQQTCTCLSITFVQYAILQGLTHYVRRKFSDIQFLQSDSASSFLDIATGLSLSLEDKTEKAYSPSSDGRKGTRKHIRRLLGLNGSCDNRPVPSMVKMLLELGLDPNEKRGGSTPWLNLLNHLETLRTQKSHLDSVWIDICKLYILFGADLNGIRRWDKLLGERLPIGRRIKDLFCDTSSPSAEELFLLVDRESQRASKKRKRPCSPSGMPLEERITRIHDRNSLPGSQKRQKANRGRKRSRI
ncbi:hypothetical protein EPUS_09357 [Endocarpon pusillum Z07020]|uniref:NACHT domain-containing protein n=1 Tax=Endocarpon pusillum (strain Z07020 / HMAS-L-300199) TaxID=1263415 RepID=U1HWJ0_ENDPU|nr:uncharacterized protein EPUS_09357 [Endocarpon pusillum Z07020]ERF73759.1 hypothetical protein EPUS_09357 [Endocarpon pusillum Z07020]